VQHPFKTVFKDAQMMSYFQWTFEVCFVHNTHVLCTGFIYLSLSLSYQLALLAALLLYECELFL